MDWSFIQKYAPMYVEAAGLTLRIGVIGILLSCILGLLCAAVQYERVPVLRRIISVYADYEATLAPVYGEAADPEALVVEGGKVE